MTAKKQVPSKEELEEKYFRYGSSISSLAREYNTSNPTVRKWLILHGISRKTHKQASTEANVVNNKACMPTKEELQDYYANNSLQETYRYFSIGQEKLYEWLSYYNIPSRNLSEGTTLGKNKQHISIQYSKEKVEEVYSKHHHIGLAAQELEISYSHMKTLMQRHNIAAILPWRSKGENDLYVSIQNLSNLIVWNSNDKKLISPYEIDIVSHERKLAIEYCGTYWHSEHYGSKQKTYHKNKFDLCNKIGYELITVFESDDVSKVISLIKTKLGLTKKVFARKCHVKVIDSKIATSFHKKHHLHSSVGASLHYGLYHKEDLLMVLSMGKPRFSKQYEWECVRMTSHSDYNVVGGASKLFKMFFRENNVKSCVTFSDLRYGKGKVYAHCGFTFVGYTQPNYWYFHKNNPKELYSRVKFQKHKLKTLFQTFDNNKTEYENMLDNKYDRIWDCGNAIWIMKQQ